ncbi:MAG: DUF6089 family protein [Flavobacteriaceae bacterium]|tara:strand:- start:562 stop:1248 length:687 start_codon:yes stop_codon:yes gene_type:complete
MKKVYFILILLINLYMGNAQIYEIGIFGGGSNFIGDVGSTKFIAPEKIAVGGLIRWNRSQRHSFRASMIYTTIAANDNLSSDPKREQRGYYFSAKTLEISAGIEFTFLDFDLHSGDFIFTPYIYTGISMLSHPNFYYVNNILIPEKTNSYAFGIPIALGAKFTLSEHFILGVEIAARCTFSDEIDGSLPDSDELSSLKFGNINNNDWYVFSGFTLTYTFGRNPCFCVY